MEGGGRRKLEEATLIEAGKACFSNNYSKESGFCRVNGSIPSTFYTVNANGLKGDKNTYKSTIRTLE